MIEFLNTFGNALGSYSYPTSMVTMPVATICLTALIVWVVSLLPRTYYNLDLPWPKWGLPRSRSLKDYYTTMFGASLLTFTLVMVTWGGVYAISLNLPSAEVEEVDVTGFIKPGNYMRVSGEEFCNRAPSACSIHIEDDDVLFVDQNALFGYPGGDVLMVAKSEREGALRGPKLLTVTSAYAVTVRSSVPGFRWVEPRITDTYANTPSGAIHGVWLYKTT